MTKNNGFELASLELEKTYQVHPEVKNNFYAMKSFKLRSASPAHCWTAKLRSSLSQTVTDERPVLVQINASTTCDISTLAIRICAILF